MSHDVARTRRRIEAEENAVIDLQFDLLDCLQQAGISKEELARRLNVSKARVSQLFAAGANPTVKQIARIFDALDRKVAIRSLPPRVESRSEETGRWRHDSRLSKVLREEAIFVRALEDAASQDAANENYWDMDDRAAA